MMKGFFKQISAFLVVVMLVTAMTGCGGDKNVTGSTGSGDSKAVTTADSEKKGPAYLNPTGMPIVNEPITINILTLGSQYNEYAKMLVWQEYEKMTGIKINWIEGPATAAELAQVRSLRLASNDLPDVFFKSNMPVGDLINYGEQGSFVDLNGFIDDYAPNLTALFKEYPEVKKGISMPNGSIYSLPYVDNSPHTRIQRKLFVNQKWLDKVGMKMPADTEGFYQALKAFLDNDGNGNGQKDEIPLSGELIDIMRIFSGSFGLNNKGGIINPYLDFDEAAGKVRFVPAQPEYKKLLEYLNKLYDENLLDKEIFTVTGAQFTAKAEQGIIGAGVAPGSATLGNKYKDDYEGVSVVLKGPDGHDILSPVGPMVRVLGSFVMTKANKHPEATMRWIDYFYSDEGSKLFFLGVEGVTFHVVNGVYDYLDSIKNDPNSSSLDQAVGKYVCYAGGANPTIITEKYFKGAEMTPKSVEVTQALLKYMPEEVWPEFKFTKEENDRMLALRSDIQAYVDESRDQFIAGKISFDQWDTYIARLEKMGLKEYMEIVQTSYDRYKSIK